MVGVTLHEDFHMIPLVLTPLAYVNWRNERAK
jgi:hypothetical protein